MKKFFVWCLALPLISFSQQYPVSEIPDSLLQNVNVVKRFEEKKLIIKSPSKAILKYKRVYTILNEQGSWAAWYTNHYDKFHDLSDISGILYDASGKEIKHIRKKDISDWASNDGFSLITDARFKQFNLMYNNYPYTVEFEDEVVYNGYFTFPSYSPFRRTKTSIQKSKFIVECQDNYALRYWIKNAPEPLIQQEKDTKIYSWNFQNLKPIEYELYQPELHYIVPYIYLGATNFEIDNYKGSLNSWKEFGLFFNELLKGRDKLPENIIQEVKAITSNLTTTEAKVNAVYDYLQKTTRYISVQLGIGGFQPFPAEYVAQKKYGDCKALSNYMVAMLKEIGVKSHNVIIAAGREDANNVIEDFPTDYFNHVVCCVPNGKDSIWLECTSQTKSAGYAGNFTGNRKALLVAEDGGYLVSTPRYRPSDNKQLRLIKASINEEGNLNCIINTTYSGQQQELQNDLIYEFTQKQKEDYLNNYISLPNYKVEKSNYKETKGRIPIIEENLEVTAPNYATVSGKRMFIIPNLINKHDAKLSTEKDRKFDIDYPHNFLDADTILITIPQGYTIETMPKNIAIKNKFGEFNATYSFEGSTIRYIRYYQRHSQRYPASDYLELTKFYEDMFKADRAKMVLVKKEG